MKFNYQKCDIYALGLICLCQALKKDIEDLYDMDNFIIDNQILEKYLTDYGQKFGILLKNQVDGKTINIFEQLKHIL